MTSPSADEPKNSNDVEGNPVLTSIRTLLQKGSEQDIKLAITDELVRQRLIYCPEINNDLTDGWGMFGFSRGFIFLIGKTHNETTTINEDMWQQAKTTKGIEVGRHFMQGLSHYGSFPISMFEYEIIRSEVETLEYERLINALEITDNDLAEVELVDVGMLDTYEHLGIDPENITELRLPKEPKDPGDWWKQE